MTTKAQLLTYEMSPALALERVQTCRRALVLLARVECRDGEEESVLRRVRLDLRGLADFLEGGIL